MVFQMLFGKMELIHAPNALAIMFSTKVNATKNKKCQTALWKGLMDQQRHGSAYYAQILTLCETTLAKRMYQTASPKFMLMAKSFAKNVSPTNSTTSMVIAF